MRRQLAFAIALASVATRADAVTLPHHMGMYTTSAQALAMLDSKLEVVVRGPIVETVVTQRYRNDADRVVEATYIFPLPADAAVSAMAIHYGTRTVHAEVVTRDAAVKRYEQAVAAGLGAGLLDQDRPDVFTQAVSAIPAHSTVEVTLRYDSVAAYHDGAWELALPLVIAPRYVPGSASGRPTLGTGHSPDTDRAPDASRVTPTGSPAAGGATEIAIELADDVSDVASPSHKLDAVDAHHFVLVDPHSDHDALIRWRSRVPATGWVEQDADAGYAAVVLSAPAAAPRIGSLACTLVLDRAPTMRGDTDAIAHPMVRALLGALGPADRVTVVGSEQREAAPPAEVARELDERWERSGGVFDLTRVLGTLHSSGGPVIIVTDGLVADDRAAIAAAGKVGAPIYVIGVGPAPNRSLLIAIANTSGGTARFAAIGDDLTALARDVTADAASPPTPIAVSWGALAPLEILPATLPRLGAGQALLVVAKVARAEHTNARSRGDVFTLGMVAMSARPIEGAVTPRGALARRWGKLELDAALADPRAATAIALSYGLASPYTSFIAIGDEVVIEGGVKRTVAVPVSVPSGSDVTALRREAAAEAYRNVQNTKSGGGHKAPPVHPKAGKDDDDGKSAEAEDSDGEDDAAAPKRKHASPNKEAKDVSEDDEAAGSTQPEPALVPKSMPVTTGERFETLAGEDAALGPANLRKLRLELALGGGLVVDDATMKALATAAVRVEYGRLWLFGGEASLWLVDGLHGQGETLATISRRGIGRWFELGAGAGVHVGDGAGPAVSLRLRAMLPPVPRLGIYLRYDGALLIHDGSHGQNAASLGLDLTF